MARTHQRVFAGLIAGLFLLTSSAVTIVVIYTMVQDSKKNDKAAANNQAIQEALKKAKEQQPVQPQNKLEGQPLAGFTPTASITQLQTIDTTPGTGDTVKAGAKVTVDYTGAVAKTGVVFQSSKDSGQPATFGLDQVIKGWTQGIPGMKVGGTRRLLIPANLAYGSTPPPGSNIPANADLVFDVTLIKIN